MIYTGYYREGLPIISNKYPHLLYWCEKQLMDWSKDYDQLHGFWVNNVYLLQHVPAEQLTIILMNGEEHLLSTHPKWERWKESMTAGEFYSYMNLETWK